MEVQLFLLLLCIVFVVPGALCSCELEDDCTSYDWSYSTYVDCVEDFLDESTVDIGTSVAERDSALTSFEETNSESIGATESYVAAESEWQGNEASDSFSSLSSTASSLSSLVMEEASEATNEAGSAGETVFDDTWSSVVYDVDEASGELSSLASSLRSARALSSQRLEKASTISPEAIVATVGSQLSAESTIRIQPTSLSPQEDISNAYLLQGWAFIADPIEETSVVTVVVDWGGVSDNATVTCSGDRNCEFEASYTFTDDDTYAVTAVGAVDGVVFGEVSVSVVVANSAPVLSVTAPEEVAEGDIVSITGSYTDSGADTHTLFVSWGDNEEESVDVSDGDFVVSHTFTRPGDYDVTFTLTDDDNGFVQDVVSATVSYVASSPQGSVGDSVVANEDSKAVLPFSPGDFTCDDSESLEVFLEFDDDLLQCDVTGTLGTLEMGDYVAAYSVPQDATAVRCAGETNFAGSETVVVRARCTEEDASYTDSTWAINVTFSPQLDGAEILCSDVRIAEDASVYLDLDLSVTDDDGSETTTVTFVNVPAGSTLDVEDGELVIVFTGADETISSNAAQSVLKLTPPANVGTDFAFTVVSTTTELGVDDVVTDQDVVGVSLTPVVDTPSLSVVNFSVHEMVWTDVPLNASLSDTDGSEVLTFSIDVTGEPEEYVYFSGGDVSNCVWALEETDTEGLQVLSSTTISSDFSMAVTATATEQETGDSASETQTISVDIVPVATLPTLTIPSSAPVVDEGGVVLVKDMFDAALTDTDGSEVLSVRLSDFPETSIIFNVTVSEDGSVTLGPYSQNSDEISDDVAIGLVSHESGYDNTVSVVAIAEETTSEDDTYETSAVATFSVEPVPDTPISSIATSAVGEEDDVIVIQVHSFELTDTDGSESLSWVVYDVPDGTVVDDASKLGSIWLLDAVGSENIFLTPSPDFAEDFVVSVQGRSIEALTGDEAVVDKVSVSVSMEAKIDTPYVTAQSVTVSEDATVPLSISVSVADTDGSESITMIELETSAAPDGSSLAADTGILTHTNDVYSLAEADLSGLTMTLPSHYAGSFSLSLDVEATEETNQQSVVKSVVLPVTVTAVADPASVVADDIVVETSTATFTDHDLSIAVTQADTDGSEALVIAISDLPSGSQLLSSGTVVSQSGTGVYTVSQSDLSSLQLRLPLALSVSGSVYTLTVTATTTESLNSDSAAVSETFDVTLVDP
eukprot:Rmarinus@m.15987